MGQCHLMVQGGHGSVSPHDLRCVSVTWLRQGRMSVTVTSWSEVSQCPLAEVGQTWVSITSWSKVGMGQCHLIVQGGHGSVSPHGLRWVTVTCLRCGRRVSVSHHDSRWTSVSVTSWFEVGHCHLAEVG